MKFKITRASDWADLGEKEFYSMSELKRFSEKHKSELIINFQDLTIIIYDDYVE
jgi:hypothetical protein